MTMRDSAGYAASGATAASLAAFEEASHELRCFVGDPVAAVDRALEASPEMTLAHALRAWLHLLGTEPGGLPVARQCLRAARSLPANERERIARHPASPLARLFVQRAAVEHAHRLSATGQMQTLAA